MVNYYRIIHLAGGFKRVFQHHLMSFEMSSWEIQVQDSMPRMVHIPAMYAVQGVYKIYCARVTCDNYIEPKKTQPNHIRLFSNLFMSCLPSSKGLRTCYCMNLL